MYISAKHKKLNKIELRLNDTNVRFKAKITSKKIAKGCNLKKKYA